MIILNENTLTQYFDFLDKLRKSGVTNMFGAGRLLSEAYEIDRKCASSILAKWMETFDPDNSVSARVLEVLK